MSTILLKMAADSGHTLSQYKMAKLYEEGKLVPKDLNTAINWYRKAELQGSPQATQKLKQLREEK